MPWTIRPATPDDAPAIVEVLSIVASERVHSAISEPWPVAEQRRYLASLPPREIFHVAVVRGDGAGDPPEIAGYQSLDLWSPMFPGMAHVGQIGTFLKPEWRGRGLGRALFAATLAHARAHGFRKFVIQVRGSNQAAQRFYAGLGFVACGRLTAQLIDARGEADDEVLMEYFIGR